MSPDEDVTETIERETKPSRIEPAVLVEELSGVQYVNDPGSIDEVPVPDPIESSALTRPAPTAVPDATQFVRDQIASAIDKMDGQTDRLGTAIELLNEFTERLNEVDTRDWKVAYSWTALRIQIDKVITELGANGAELRQHGRSIEAMVDTVATIDERTVAADAAEAEFWRECTKIARRVFIMAYITIGGAWLGVGAALAWWLHSAL